MISPEVDRVLRAAAQLILEQPPELIAELDQAIVDATPEPLQADVTFAAEAAASTRANLLHWARCTVEDPSARVPAVLGAEVLAVARDAVRRGQDQLVFATYHAGQNVAWRFGMQAIFSLSSDPATLAEALDVAARSIFSYVDDMLAALHEQMERERAELTHGTHAERFEVVGLILEGAPIATDRAGMRLGYDLTRRHTAAILWSDPVRADHAELGRAAEALARAAGAGRPLTVIASASSLWLWFVTAEETGSETAAAVLAPTPGVRAALGRSGSGIEGFRVSHLDALATQRLMHNVPADLQVARFADVELVALAAQDIERAREFAARTLGELAGADQELRHTLRTYIREGFSASRAARVLFAHRNTVLGRLRRAERLLPEPLGGRGIEVGLALEIVQWLEPV